MDKINIFTFVNYRDFIKEYLYYLKSKHRISMRSICSKSSITPAYISMVISGKRSLDLDKAKAFIDNLKLTETEKRFFKLLVVFNDSDDLVERNKTFEKLKQYKVFKDNYQMTFNAHEYLSKWYYVAIRELSLLEEFKEDPVWIQERFFPKLSLLEVRKAIFFLKQNNLIGNRDSLNIECIDSVFSLSLKQFHSQMLDIAKNSMDQVSRDQRSIVGHTVALEKEDYAKAQGIMDRALEEIRDLERSNKNDKEIYHFYLINFKLTKDREK